MKGSYLNNCGSHNIICDNDIYQAFPTKGKLHKNINLKANELKLKIKQDYGNKLFIYPLSTIKFVEDSFLQEGSAPNFQGDLITLCTCMHRMRTKITSDEGWKSVWICGVKKPNYLFYLMKVDKAYESMYRIVNNLNKNTVNQKDSRSNRLGDLFIPNNKILFNSYQSEVDPNNYYAPIKNHSHSDSWHKDIISYKNKKTFYLIGNPEYSFIWSKAIIKFNFELYPGWKSIAVGEFLLDPKNFFSVLE